MTEISDKTFGGERPLYASHNLAIRNVKIDEGESGLKECSDIRATDCEFVGKYPFWHVDRLEVEGCTFREGARAALWYVHDMTMRNTLIEAPKTLREITGLTLENVRIPKAVETLWYVRGARLRNVEVAEAEYIFDHSQDIDIDGYCQQGKYSFQYCRNVVIRNAVIDTKDAFWHTENVTVYDSEVKGEYLAWYSKNLRLVRCRISGTQPLCYCENLTMEDCEMAPDCDLAFENSSVNITVRGAITSVKNPQTGRIAADSIEEIILDKHIRRPADCEIVCKEKKGCLSE